MKAIFMAHKLLWLVLIIFLLILVFPIGCVPGRDSSQGFRLPEGNAAKGKIAFVELNCVRCHSVDGDEDAVAGDVVRDIHVVLGGETTRVKTYGQLVTSVIYPDHIILPKYRADFTDRDGNSEMPDLTEDMTVKQLIDLVTYLESTYKVVPPQYAYDMTYP